MSESQEVPIPDKVIIATGPSANRNYYHLTEDCMHVSKMKHYVYRESEQVQKARDLCTDCKSRQLTGQLDRDQARDGEKGCPLCEENPSQTKLPMHIEKKHS